MKSHQIYEAAEFYENVTLDYQVVKLKVIILRDYEDVLIDYQNIVIASDILKDVLNFYIIVFILKP